MVKSIGHMQEVQYPMTVNTGGVVIDSLTRQPGQDLFLPQTR